MIVYRNVYHKANHPTSNRKTDAGLASGTNSFDLTVFLLNPSARNMICLVNLQALVSSQYSSFPSSLLVAPSKLH